MNRPLLPASILVPAVSALAGGPININNFIDGTLRPINFPAFSPDGRWDGTGVFGSTWRAEFVAGDGSIIGDPVAFRSPGRLDFRFPSSADRIVTGTPGVAQDITVRVWDTATALTWNDAFSAFIHTSHGFAGPIGSSTFSYTIPLPGAPSGSDRILNFQGINLIGFAVIPEPATTALGVAGVAALLWQGLRLKKR